jgi:excinuclease ABC subunit A
MDRLLRLLHRLRDTGNTVLVVEHDPDAIRAADYMVELGPASGDRGGQLVFAGPSRAFAESPLTGAYLTGAREIPVPEARPSSWTAVDHAHRRPRAQSQGCGHQDSARRGDRGDRRVGLGKSTLIHDVLPSGARDTAAR